MAEGEIRFPSQTCSNVHSNSKSKDEYILTIFFSTQPCPTMHTYHLLYPFDRCHAFSHIPYHTYMIYIHMYLNPTPHMHIFQFVEARSCRRSTSQRRLNFKPFFLPLPTPPFPPPPPCSSSSLSQQPRQRERERRNCLSPSSLIFYLLSHFSFLGCMILHGFTFFFFFCFFG